MKYIILFLGVGVIVFVISACKAKRGVMVEQIHEPIISLSKGRCFGKCSVYRLDIYADKSAKYTGTKNVEKVGEFKCQISDDEYNNLITLLNTQKFVGTEIEYLSGARDLQRISIIYDNHSVDFHLRKAPERIKLILQHLEELIERIDWQPSDI